MGRALDLYPDDPGSTHTRDVGYFQAMHHLLVTNFHIRKIICLFYTYNPAKVLENEGDNVTYRNNLTTDADWFMSGKREEISI